MRVAFAEDSNQFVKDADSGGAAYLTFDKPGRWGCHSRNYKIWIKQLVELLTASSSRTLQRNGRHARDQRHLR